MSAVEKNNYPELFTTGELTFLLELTDAVNGLPSEEAVFEHTCRAYSSALNADDVVIYDFTSSTPQLKCRYPDIDLLEENVEGYDTCINHFHHYLSNPELTINDVSDTDNPSVFKNCGISSICGVLIREKNKGIYLLELRNRSPKVWLSGDVKLLKEGFTRVLVAVEKLVERDKLRKQNFDLEVSANALGQFRLMLR